MRYNRVTKEEGKMAKKAPGKHYRRGLTLSQLFKKFPDEGAAQVWFSEEFWPDGPYCPHCGSINVQASIKHPTMTHRCRDCPNRRMFSPKTGTVMQGSPLSYRTWAIAIYLVTTNLKGVSSMKLHRDLGISQKSAWFLAHRLRETWKTHYFFKGPVEVDETFVGGNRKNMSRKKRKELSGTGRGPKGKTIVAGVKDRDTNKVSARVVKATDAHTLQLFINERVCKTATVYTDEHGGYASLKNDHEAVKHFNRRVRQGRGQHPRHRVLLGHAQARPQRHVSQAEPKAFGPACPGILRAAQRARDGHHQPDAGDGYWHAPQTAAIHPIDRL